MNADCRDALEALARALSADAALDPASRAHLAGCGACRARVAAAIDDRDETSHAPDAAALEEAARRRCRGRQLRRGAALGLGALLLVALGAVPLRGGEWRPGGAALAAVALGALGLAAALAVALGRLPGWLGLFKRLGRGRQVSGVCLGLAERTGTPAWAWRAGFLALLALGGSGLWLYLLLDLAMPVHPEDRAHLLRHRLARWWRRLRTA